MSQDGKTPTREDVTPENANGRADGAHKTERWRSLIRLILVASLLGAFFLVGGEKREDTFESTYSFVNQALTGGDNGFNIGYLLGTMAIFVFLAALFQLLVVDIFVVMGYTSDSALQTTTGTIRVLDTVTARLISTPGRDGSVGKSLGGLATFSSIIVIPILLASFSEAETQERIEKARKDEREQLCTQLATGALEPVCQGVPPTLVKVPGGHQEKANGILEQQLTAMAEISTAIRAASEELSSCSEQLKQSQVEKQSLAEGILQMSERCAAGIDRCASSEDIDKIEAQLPGLEPGCNDRLGNIEARLDRLSKENRKNTDEVLGSIADTHSVVKSTETAVKTTEVAVKTTEATVASINDLTKYLAGRRAWRRVREFFGGAMGSENGHLTEDKGPTSDPACDQEPPQVARSLID